MTDLRTAMLQLLAKGHNGQDFRQGSEGAFFDALAEIRPDMDQDDGRAALAVWHDLYREGVIAWGSNLHIANRRLDKQRKEIVQGTDRDHFTRGRPMYRVTEQGNAVIAEASRDPGNADGYLAHVAQWLPNDGIARSYVEEALHTHRTRCDRATAFLIGGATESLTLHLRDLVKQCGGRHADIDDFRVRRVIDALRAIVDPWTRNPPRDVQPITSVDLKERWLGVYPSLAHFIRSTRNDAGHPAMLGTIDHADAHAMFLAFTCIAEMLRDVGEWIAPGQWK